MISRFHNDACRHFFEKIWFEPAAIFHALEFYATIDRSEIAWDTWKCERANVRNFSKDSMAGVVHAKNSLDFKALPRWSGEVKD